MVSCTDLDLDSILQSTQGNSLLPEEIDLLIDAFLPTHTHTLRSKAYIVLSAASQHLRETNSTVKDQQDTSPVAKIFAPSVSAKLGDTDQNTVLSGLCFLTALFQVDIQAASAILQLDGITDCVADSLDLFSASIDISRAVAQLVSQAAGHKACRAIIPPQCIEWLDAKSRQSKDNALRAAAAVALVKLSRGAAIDSSTVTGAEKPVTSTTDDTLVKMMKNLVVSNPDSSSLNDAVEGLAYMSTEPAVKELLSKDRNFLSRLFTIIPRRKLPSSQPTDTERLAATPIYGTVVVISNLCAYLPQLTEEEAQIAKLRRMASAASDGARKGAPVVDPLEDSEHVKERCRRLIAAGVLEALTAATRATDSRTTRMAVGKALLSLIEDQDHRGKVLQAGGAKALITIISGILPSDSKKGEIPQLDRADIEPIQALAKLSITASPVQVFGPNEGALYDAIRPFAVMLLHPSSSLLQRFESIMALTNLSSQGPEIANRIAKADGLMNKVELLMLEDHTLVRRAATELICNLISGSEEVYNNYGGDKTAGSKSKLHVLLALCDVDDLPTRLAASGALAVLTDSPNTCQLLLELEQEKHRVMPILGQLIDPSIRVLDDHEEEEEEEEETEVEEIHRPADADPGLVHRGVVCVRNFLVGINSAARKGLQQDAARMGLVHALVQVLSTVTSGADSPVLRPAAEALKCLIGSERGLAIEG